MKCLWTWKLSWSSAHTFRYLSSTSCPQELDSVQNQDSAFEEKPWEIANYSQKQNCVSSLQGRWRKDAKSGLRSFKDGELRVGEVLDRRRLWQEPSGWNMARVRIFSSLLYLWWGYEILIEEEEFLFSLFFCGGGHTYWYSGVTPDCAFSWCSENHAMLGLELGSPRCKTYAPDIDWLRNHDYWDLGTICSIGYQTLIKIM